MRLLCSLPLLLACSTTAHTTTSAASAEDLAELVARVEALEAEQVHQAEALAECLDLADDAAANAAAAQERSAELLDVAEDHEARIVDLEAWIDILTTAIEALQG